MPATTPGQPSRTLHNRGAQPEASRKRRFDTRCERVITALLEPSTVAAPRGAIRGVRMPRAPAMVATNSARRTGSSSTTL
jgi:hypothetical protein